MDEILHSKLMYQDIYYQTDYWKSWKKLSRKEKMK